MVRCNFPPLVPTPAVYTHDGSLEGFLSAVFAAFAHHEEPVDIVSACGMQGNLLAETIDIPTNVDHALRVRAGIENAAGDISFERVKYAFLADEPGHGHAILRFIVRIMREGRSVTGNLADPDIAAFEPLHRAVANERHRMLQFLRFSKLENDVYFARINPKYDVVPLLMNHFSARFNTQPFMIYDEVHNTAGIWDLKQWYLVRPDTLTIPDLHEDEQRYRIMWKTFYDRICNEQRLNPQLRTQFMPQRLWCNITEMVTVLPSSSLAAV